jgi:hypothetical protein
VPNTMDREAVSVALLYQTSQLEGHLKEALKELGAAVVYEALTAQMDRDALEGSGAHVVIVNLDPEIESHLDEVYDLLDDDRYNVVFNDAQVSSELSGWEQARWSRHLAAKIMGRPEVADPPRPPGSVAPPSPVQKIARGIPDVPQQAPPSNTFAPDAAATAMFSSEVGLDDALDALFKQATPPAPAAAPTPPPRVAPPAAPPVAAAPPSAAADFSFDFDAMLSAPAAPAAPVASRSSEITLELPVPPQVAASAPASDFDFDASLSARPPAATAADDFALDLDFAVAPAAKAASDEFDLGLDLDAIPTNPVAATSGGGELDFDFDLGAMDLPEPAVATATREQARDIASDFGFSDSDFGADPFGGLDAALEPGSISAATGDVGSDENFSFGPELDALFDSAPEPAAPKADLVDFDSAFGGSASPTSEQADDFAASIPTAREAAPASRGEDKAARSFDLSRFSLEAMSDDEVPAAPAANLPKVEKVSTESFLSGGNWSLEDLNESDDGGAAAPAPAVDKVTAQDYLAPEGGDASKFDFGSSLNLDLIPMEDAVSPDQDRSDFFVEHRLDSANAVKAIRRVIVLGASIGGPEAVREYLSGLPARFPALFVLAQHMGAEFLELMAAQLAKATALTVRAPGHGERVSQGEVVVVPTTHRLLIDADGVVQLAHLPEASPYTPSIDLIVRDVADTFGSQATVIIFSGMAHDAIEGAKHLTAKGGQVWAQDPDTCVISSMVDGARDAGVVVFTGSPGELSKHTIASIGKA